MPEVATPTLVIVALIGRGDPALGVQHGEPPGVNAPAMKTDGQHKAAARPHPICAFDGGGSPPVSTNTAGGAGAPKPIGPAHDMPMTSAASPRMACKPARAVCANVGGVQRR